MSLEWNGALDSDSNHDAAAIALCRKMNWSGPLMRGGFADGSHVYTFDMPENRVFVEPLPSHGRVRGGNAA